MEDVEREKDAAGHQYLRVCTRMVSVTYKKYRVPGTGVSISIVLVAGNKNLPFLNMIVKRRDVYPSRCAR